MTIPYPAALGAVRQRSATQLRQSFEGLSVAETVELGTFIGPDRLRAVMAVAPGDAVSALAEVNRQAFNVAPGPAPTASANPRLPEQVRLALLDVASRRRAGPLLTMPSDATATLPTPTRIPPPLGDSEYAAAAQRQSVEISAIKAVAIVESGGRTGFDAQGRPKILFEAHHFGRWSGNRFNRTHPHLSVPAREWRSARRYYGWNQYQRLHEAMLLDIDAALKAASWGKFQVLGSNHSGWPDVRSFVTAMYQSEVNHLMSFEAFCNEKGIMRFVRSKEWRAFAMVYNGASQQGYDQRMEDAYAAARGRQASARR